MIPIINRKLPVGLQSFTIMREDRYVYVDKTALVFKLILGRVYFLSRPRRFGKSLLVSTLKSYFLGEKELFRGLYIERAEEELAAQEGRPAWEVYPVLDISFGGGKYTTPDDLLILFDRELYKLEKRYQIPKQSDNPTIRFYDLITECYTRTGKRVVVLVDEYDKPLLSVIDNPELHESYRVLLAGFYEVVKDSDHAIRFALLTGVTKFSKVTIFSGLNNLMDISLQSDFAAICGITQQELEQYFSLEIDQLAQNLALSREEALVQLKEKYDGYRFSDGSENVYNPFSLVNAFYEKKLKNYWFTSGTASSLVKLLKGAHYFIPQLDGNLELTESQLDTYRAVVSNPIPILLQAGYLTIKDYDSELQTYRLGFPNSEVRIAFMENLLPTFIDDAECEEGLSIPQFRNDILKGDVDAFMKRMRSVLSAIPYSQSPTLDVRWREENYQNVVYTIFILLGLRTESEAHCATGRVDCTLYTPEYVYLFEFKLWSAGTAEEALQQLKARDYASRHRSSHRKIVLVGTSFDEQKRTIGEWVVER